jgi:dTDP-4-dehydrorhamnose 3,5-epimerase
VIFEPLALPGVFLIRAEPVADPRGEFARIFCAEEFRAHGLDARVAQSSTSVTRRRGTVRGMHWQAAPWGEAKLVRCLRGAVYDVALDLRPDSPAFRRWAAVELAAPGREALYLPEGVAHGYQALQDDAELLYQMSVPYHPEAGRGARWNDPAFGISWPIADALLSERDAGYPDFDSKR